MQLKPEAEKIYGGVKDFFVGLGPVLSIALIAIVVIVLWYLFSYASEGWQEHQANKQIDAYKAEAQKQEQIAVQKDQEAQQAIGAAAAYKQQADQLNQERSALLNARPELQSKVDAAAKKSESIRNQALRPITNDMRQRVGDLSTKLDKLYPDH